MSNEPASMYDSAWAEAYARLADASIPGRNGLYRLCVAALADLTGDAQILVVGAGTGEELIALADALPRAHFVAVEPATAMGEVCRFRLQERGYTDRVRFHHGVLSSLPPMPLFSAATAVLVSQHTEGPNGAHDFFAEIRHRLQPEAPIFCADAHVPEGVDRNWLMELWCTQLVCTGIPAEQARQMRARIEQGISIREESELVL